MRDYEIFLRDIEEDPELASQVNKYKETDVMAMLENKMRKMNFEEKKEPEKKKVKAKRKTDQGKAMQYEAKLERKKEQALMKAIVGEDSDVEEDFPAVKLGELLEEMKLEDDED